MPVPNPWPGHSWVPSAGFVQELGAEEDKEVKNSCSLYKVKTWLGRCLYMNKQIHAHRCVWPGQARRLLPLYLMSMIAHLENIVSKTNLSHVPNLIT